jgi:hypothetical protein
MDIAIGDSSQSFLCNIGVKDVLHAHIGVDRLWASFVYLK